MMIDNYVFKLLILLLRMCWEIARSLANITDITPFKMETETRVHAGFIAPYS